jgi:hypothetical protein
MILGVVFYMGRELRENRAELAKWKADFESALVGRGS